MARLITNHDPYHIHKILGLLVLLHTAYRFIMVIGTGNAFPENEPMTTKVGGVVAHGILSCTSLLLPLPKHRNFSSPMIWPEFRFHSIIFAMRHVIATILNLLNAWPKALIPHTLAKAALVFGTMLAADQVTENYGDREKRTTNAMPYPSSVSEQDQQHIKNLYASTQFVATSAAMMPDATFSWSPLLGIQSAPFLMTLVRKGKCDSSMYHRVYALMLWSNYLIALVRWSYIPGLQLEVFWSGALTYALSLMRLIFKMEKYTVWIVYLSLVMWAKSIQGMVEWIIGDVGATCHHYLGMVWFASAVANVGRKIGRLLFGFSFLPAQNISPGGLIADYIRGEKAKAAKRNTPAASVIQNAAAMSG